MIRTFVPVYIDQFQAAAATHVKTTATADGLTAHFADGSTQPSVYATVEAMLEAGRRDFRERVREVSPSTEYASSETAYGRTVGYGFAIKVF